MALRYAGRTDTLTEELKSLKASIQAEEATLAKMKSKTWGLSLHEDTNGRFIVLPKGIRHGVLLKKNGFVDTDIIKLNRAEEALPKKEKKNQ